ncbi:hypothetical protein TNIN_216511 [Trichonephila inaurata madagascariensis]|uniref:Uncharacterized protein n=1 Tax=Trichonephila inaurata madagascariensis TaxID=2747483 RepID=A0A8X6YY18_9ARAC|nr:hypothetical protein TNIN_216511 [Trichonephila inaurata madagascariensis]
MFSDKPEALLIQRESVHKISRKITGRYFTYKTTGTFLTITSQTSGTYQLVALTVLTDKFFQQYLGVLRRPLRERQHDAETILSSCNQLESETDSCVSILVGDFWQCFVFRKEQIF